jgi:hypothetical protein
MLGLSKVLMISWTQVYISNDVNKVSKRCALDSVCSFQKMSYTKLSDLHKPRGYFLVIDFSLNIALFRNFCDSHFFSDILKKNRSYILKRAWIAQLV